MTSYMLLEMLMANCFFKASLLHKPSGVGLQGFVFNKSFSKLALRPRDRTQQG